MDFIIPYEEKLYTNDGTFIDPDGNILFTFENHLGFATHYCCGEEYDYLSRLRYANPYFASQKNIDIFSCTQLNKEQLELLKIYLKNFELSNQYAFSDFLVYFLHFDKVETSIRRCITTTNSQPHIRFYNYYLMDWRIEQHSPLKYNSETFEFECDKKYDWLASQEDKEAEEEIREIKSRVLIKDRYLFFK